MYDWENTGLQEHIRLHVQYMHCICVQQHPSLKINTWRKLNVTRMSPVTVPLWGVSGVWHLVTRFPSINQTARIASVRRTRKMDVRTPPSEQKNNRTSIWSINIKDIWLLCCVLRLLTSLRHCLVWIIFFCSVKLGYTRRMI